jgi:hypothetical protein
MRFLCREGIKLPPACQKIADFIDGTAGKKTGYLRDE